MLSEHPPICRGCGEGILTESVVQALNGDWHPKCFRCSSCGQRLNNWYFQNAGNLYCRRDYLFKFGDRCNGCSHIITGPVMVAGEHKYHPECFQCSHCQTLIGDGEAYALVERSFLYCDQCFQTGPAKPYLPQAQVPKTETSPSAQTPRRKPHSIQMVEIPPTPDYQSQPHRHQNHHNEQQQQQPQQIETTTPRRLQLSLQVTGPDTSSAGWRGSTSYRHSFTLEGGRLTPCVQISEIECSQELHGLAVGDKILEVNGTAVKDKTLEEIKNLLTNYKDKVHVMLERDLSPLRLPPDEDSFPPTSPSTNVPSRNASSDDLNSTSASEGETVVVLDQTVRLRPKGSLRARRHSPTRRRSKSPSPCASAKQKSIDLSRSHSFSTRQQDHRAFRATDLLIGEVLGQGFFGQALKATHRLTGEQMVLKELHNFDESAQKSFLREVSMLRSLSHPCVLKFLGVLYRDKKLNLITEFIDGGTLSDLLLDHSVELSWKQRIAFAKDIADGMKYLHSMNIIHRDLNSQNCLVRKDQSVVVADFGLAKIFPRREFSQFSSLLEKEKEGVSGIGASSAGGRKKKRFSRRKRGTVVGNPYWMAPEMMTKGVYDEKVDVFSYGIIVCETIARVTADPDYLPRSLDFGLNVEAFHQRFCNDVPEPYFMLGVLCSQIEPDQRPSFENIHVLCEALHLHVEHGMAVPAELQGSTVQFYRTSKETLYGHTYKDVDSCTQVNTHKNQEIVVDTPDDEQITDELQTVDSEADLSFVSASDGGNESVYRGDETVINAELNGASTNASDSFSCCAEKLDNKVLVNIDDCSLCFDCYKDGSVEKPLSAEICKSITHNSSSSLTSTLKMSNENKDESQDIKISVDDKTVDSSLATASEDYAYFSCSSESPSVSISSPCLSIEDFTSCKNSPVSSESNVTNKNSELEPESLPSETMDVKQDIWCHNSLADAAEDSNERIMDCEEVTMTSDQMPVSAAFLVETAAQNGTSCKTNMTLFPAVTDSFGTRLKHSSGHGSIPCTPPRDYLATMQLEFGTQVSPPVLSSHTFSLPATNSDDCDV